MDTEEIRGFVHQWGGVEENVKWEVNRCFCVFGKMFLVLYHTEEQPWITFKVSQEDFDLLILDNLFEPAPYLARHYWINLRDRTKVSETDLKAWLYESYFLVADKLPKNQRTRCTLPG